MENPYIEAFILPAEGGKLIGAVEKSTQKEFIYYNHVLKFRNISMRGPWTSGGIELNFGIIGHAPSTASPVDYLIRKNPDGSVSCIVGTMDLPSRTQWRVRIHHPARQGLSGNPLALVQPAAAGPVLLRVDECAQKSVPGSRIYLSGNDVDRARLLGPQPALARSAKDGRDLALYKNTSIPRRAASSSTARCRISPAATGTIPISDTATGRCMGTCPARSSFRWSLSRAGAIWENLLTDSDGQYFEHQTGRLLDQSDVGFFAPYSADHWQELYFPYKQIGPMVKATPYGALNVRGTAATA